MGKPHLTSMKFADLDLHDSLKESLADNGYEFCTEIQEKALPDLLKGRDVTGQAQTGTGKTATFLLATLNHLMTTPVEEGKKGPYAIIMAPTRELAVQIYDDAKMLGRYTGLKYALLYGGAAYGTQSEALEADPDIVIGTVGRILDFFKQRKFNLRNVEVFVLDEADRMFDLGFINDIRFLLRQMPKATERQNMLFSATFSQRILELAYEHMNNPLTIKVESEQVTGSRIEQRLYHVASDEKLSLLFGLLKKEEAERSIVFVNTKRVAEHVFEILNANGFKAAVLSGDIPQNRREKLLEAFKNGELDIMVATDVAARGLHIPDVSHVFNYDLPQDVEDYVHRIGRTARAGAEGTAISFACEEYVYSLMDIQDYIKEEIPVATITDELLIAPEVTINKRGRGRKNRSSHIDKDAQNRQRNQNRGNSKGNRNSSTKESRDDRKEERSEQEKAKNSSHNSGKNSVNEGKNVKNSEESGSTVAERVKSSSAGDIEKVQKGYEHSTHTQFTDPQEDEGVSKRRKAKIPRRVARRRKVADDASLKEDNDHQVTIKSEKSSTRENDNKERPKTSRRPRRTLRRPRRTS